MNDQHNDMPSTSNVHTCGKCKSVFDDVESFFDHNNSNQCCTSDEETVKLNDCMEAENSTSNMDAENNDNKVEDCVQRADTAGEARRTSPIIQTVMLTTSIADADAETAGSFINERGESLHFVVLSGSRCTFCSKFFPTNAALEDHIAECHNQLGDNSFLCPQCNRVCKTAASLKNHIETHTAERPFICTYKGCTYTFKTKGSLVRHERRHTDSRPFKCELCGRAFRESGALNRHRKSRMPCSQKRDTELPNYGKNMPLPGQAKAPETEQDPLETHLLSEEFLVPELSSCKDSELFLEPDKPVELLTKSAELLTATKESDAMEQYTKDIMQLEDEQLVQNMNKSVGSGTVTVRVVHDRSNVSVQRVDSDAPSVDQSVEQGAETVSHSGEGQQPVPVAEYFSSCQMCGVQFAKTNELKEHLRGHLSADSFLCDQCSFVGTRQEFTAHITHTHSAPTTANTELMSSEKLYESKSVDSLRTVSPQQAVREAIQLIQQLLILDNAFEHDTLSEVKEKVLTLKSIKNCPVCDKTFRSPSYLRHHIRVHTGERPYKCKLCPKDFPTKDTFKKHMLCHSDERSFKCGECGKLFKRITHAREHLKIHSNDRPYTCPICKKSFKTATIYKVHARTHTMHMPWVCKICAKRFREKASLTRHVRVHTGDKPFKCGYCEKMFSEHGTLSRHLRAKVPCSAKLADARRPALKTYPTEEQLQTIVITEEGDIACPSVLNEFSAVVTDTQEYLPPQSQHSDVAKDGVIHTSDLVSGLAVSEEGGSSHGTYYLVDGEVRLAYAMQSNTLDHQESKGEDGVVYEQPTSAQYVYLEDLGAGEHPMSLTEQTTTDQVILMEDS